MAATDGRSTRQADCQKSVVRTRSLRGAPVSDACSFRSSCILDDTYALDGHQRAPSDHLIQNRQQLVDVRLVIDHFDQYWQVARELHETCCVDDTVRSEPSDSVDHGGTGK